MRMVKCPHCGELVDEICIGKTCSSCGGRIYSEEFLSHLVFSRIRTIRRSDSYDLLVQHIENGDCESATMTIRDIIGKKDIMVEPVIIKDLLKPMTEEQERNRVSSFLRYCRKNKQYETIKTMVWNGDEDGARETIRIVSEYKDKVMEDAVIRRIMQDRPRDWAYTRAPTAPQYKTKDNTDVAPKLITCPACNHQISIRAQSCPNCGNPTGVHVCPKCNSINTKVITGASKATSVFLWGAFAANKVVSKFQCKDCGHKF